MNTWKRVWRRIKHTVLGKPPRVVQKRPSRSRLVARGPRPYPASLSLTAFKILRALTTGPMTRGEVSAAIAPTTTAATHLPRLRECGYVVYGFKEQRFLYAITEIGIAALAEGEKGA